MNRNSIALLAGTALWLASASAHADVPDIVTPVNDYAGVLSGSEETDIEQELVGIRERTGVQVAVLLVKTTAGQPIDDFALAVFDKWGGGSSKRNDGVLLVLAVNDRRMRIEVGYDLEDRLTDSRSRQILEEMKTSLRAGDYGGGVSKAVDNIGRVTDGLEPVVAYQRPRSRGTRSGGSRGPRSSGGCDGGGAIFLIVLIIIVAIVAAAFGGGSSGGSSSGWGSGSSWSSWGSSSSSSTWSSSSSSSTSFGGGGSTSWGGGGGSSGGGGASSGW